jgi:hypothetical protein
VTAKYLIVVAIVFVLALAPRLWRMRRLADQRAQDSWPDLPLELRGPNRTFVVFTTRYCAQCGPVARALGADHDATVHVVDVEREPQLAAAYRVKSAPTVIEAGREGHVRRRLVGADAVLDAIDAS